jgi:hypothetical protein
MSFECPVTVEIGGKTPPRTALCWRCVLHLERHEGRSLPTDAGIGLNYGAA